MNLGLIGLLSALQITNLQPAKDTTIQQDSLTLLRDSVVQMVSYEDATRQRIPLQLVPEFFVSVPAYCKYLNVSSRGLILSVATCDLPFDRSVLLLSRFKREISIEGYLIEKGVLLTDLDADGTLEGCSLPIYINRYQTSNTPLDIEECTLNYHSFLREFKDAVSSKYNSKIISSS